VNGDFQFYVGIDWASVEHEVCARDVILGTVGAVVAICVAVVVLRCFYQ